jgi:6-phosphogluconolactonase
VVKSAQSLPALGGGVHSGLMISRRTFLQTGALLPFAIRAFALQNARPSWVLLGTDSGGIFRARWTPATGELGVPELAIAADRPDYFAMHPKLPVMYSVDAVGNGKGAVSGFRIDRRTAELVFVNKVSSHGDGPCFVSVDHAGKEAFVANYSSGTVGLLPLDKNGKLGVGDDFDNDTPHALGSLGPVKSRQDRSHPHCAVISPRNRFAMVCDLGRDFIFGIPIQSGDHTPGLLVQIAAVAARKGSGPRHVAFHPNGRWMYCIHELDCTIDLYDFDELKPFGGLKLRTNSVISTLAPDTPVGDNTACELLISPDGRFAYACTRFVDQITVYRIDPVTGLLTEQQRLTAGGRIPRLIAFDPTRRWLVACNQGLAPNPVGNVAVFAHEPATGRVDPTPRTFAAETPMCIQWL